MIERIVAYLVAAESQAHHTAQAHHESGIMSSGCNTRTATLCASPPTARLVDPRAFQGFVVLIDTDANVTQYLAKQRTHDHLCAVIRDNDYSPFGVSEGVVTTMPTLPLKTTALSYLA
jgi:hypothetical protein